MNFNNLDLELYNNTVAALRITVSFVTKRTRYDNSLSNLSYITQSGRAVINPDTYLTFTYNTGDYKTSVNLSMSYPQLYPLREAMEKTRLQVLDPELYQWSQEKGLTMAYKPEEAWVTGIGRDNRSIMFVPAITTDENGVQAKTVHIKLSNSDYASVLTIDEFLTVYEIVRTVDLPTLQLVVGLSFLQGQEQNSGYQAPQKPANTYQPPRGGGYQQAPVYTQKQPNPAVTPVTPTRTFDGLSTPQNNPAVTPVTPTRTFDGLSTPQDQLKRNNNFQKEQSQTGSEGARGLINAVKNTKVSTVDLNEGLGLDDIFEDDFE